MFLYALTKRFPDPSRPLQGFFLAGATKLLDGNGCVRHQLHAEQSIVPSWLRADQRPTGFLNKARAEASIGLFIRMLHRAV
jgi:hypothetical protein